MNAKVVNVAKASVTDWLRGKLCEVGVSPGFPKMEIIGDFEATLHGCKRIIQYSPEKIKLEVKKKGGTVTFEGSELVCTSFFVGAVVIEGKIERVEFSIPPREVKK